MLSLKLVYRISWNWGWLILTIPRQKMVREELVPFLTFELFVNRSSCWTEFLRICVWRRILSYHKTSRALFISLEFLKTPLLFNWNPFDLSKWDFSRITIYFGYSIRTKWVRNDIKLTYVIMQMIFNLFCQIFSNVFRTLQAIELFISDIYSSCRNITDSVTSLFSKSCAD